MSATQQNALDLCSGIISHEVRSYLTRLFGETAALTFVKNATPAQMNMMVRTMRVIASVK
jgi:hypothetical protein